MSTEIIDLFNIESSMFLSIRMECRFRLSPIVGFEQRGQDGLLDCREPRGSRDPEVNSLGNDAF